MVEAEPTIKSCMSNKSLTMTSVKRTGMKCPIHCHKPVEGYQFISVQGSGPITARRTGDITGCFGT